MSSKVAQYLNEHLVGEVTTNDHVRQQYSTDGSILTVTPDLVAYPRVTSDLRKIARFAWQLAEKGHALSVTPRGGGTDQTGGAIGPGVIVDLSAHMNMIFELDAKQKLVRVQPGVSVQALNEALRLQNLYIPALVGLKNNVTVGGAIANNIANHLSGKYGAVGSWVSQLEIVLANGEILQTGKVSKRDVSRKRGLQTYEGEVYRTIGDLLNDKAETIATIATDTRDNVGYNIAYVEYRDGSIDLTPLFIGSQGTLGIISEVILKVLPVPEAPLVGAIAFTSYDGARDAIDTLRALSPSTLELIDGRLFVKAEESGKRYQFYVDATEQGEVAAVVLIEFDGNTHAKKKAAKKIAKLFENEQAYVSLERDPGKIADLQMLGSLTQFVQVPQKSDFSTPALLNGIYIPPERFEDFAKAVAALESKYNVDLPLSGHAYESIYYAYPLLSMQKVGDRQKVFKLLAEWATAVGAHGGHIVAENGEGRLKAPFAYKELDDDVKELYTAIRTLFDPLNTMNVGVKQDRDIKKLIAELRTDYVGDDSAWHAA